MGADVLTLGAKNINVESAVHGLCTPLVRVANRMAAHTTQGSTHECHFANDWGVCDISKLRTESTGAPVPPAFNEKIIAWVPCQQWGALVLGKEAGDEEG